MLDKDCILDHVAVAVKDLEKSVKIYEDMGLSFSKEREVVESQGVTTAFAAMDENAHLELLCPYGEDGPIHKYLAKKGEGIHHMCFKVPDVEKKCQELREKGYVLLYEKPTVGAGNCLVNFVHPKSTGGVLLEISQKLK
ncbi:methylmalonyl-CoA epimerase [Halobacteriovorax sp. GB3]|uniref:methylmalonyl-CoA epimerase n=1 Tax=Halobacteriovorax sp. GB3 TaxID=2719615 RepID=UPI00235F7BA1|nr:methylmalonyl-CoA epimerase [Halobacteriovorax sp. GB3]MDD0852211.1 methylmalonyl-CoA epimerase [Halobacteriovorax sp. GB3]